MSANETRNESSRRSVKRKKEKKRSHSKKKSKKSHRKKRDRSTSSSSNDSSQAHSIETEFSNLANYDTISDYTVDQAVDVAKRKLREILANEPVFNDLAEDVMLEEVSSLIALEKGQAIKLELVRGDGSVLFVVVPIDATVAQLKRQVEQATLLKLRRDGQHHRRHLKRPINWKYVWKTYWLFAHGTKMKDDQAILSDYGMNNHDRISFIKRLKVK